MSLSLAGLGLIVATLALATGESSTSAQGANCDARYPDFCVPSAPPDLDCTDLLPGQVNFRVYEPDPHDFDIDDDGIGCEDPESGDYPRRELPIKVFAIMAVCDGCGQGAPLPTSTPTGVSSATNTATSAATATPTKTATPTVPGSPTATPTRTNTPPPTLAVCGGSTAQISGLNKSGSPETVAITGSGLMTGWYLISESGNQRFDFPAGYFLNSSVVIESGPGATHAPPARLLWTNSNIWNNSSDDDAFLYDCTGALKSTFEDGQ